MKRGRFLILAIGVTLLLLSNIFSVLALPTPYHYYRFEFNDTRDTGSNSTRSVLQEVNSPLYTVNGKLGNAINLNWGTNQFLINDTLSVDRIRTIDEWVYFNSTLADDFIIEISDGSSSDRVSLSTTGSSINFRIYNGTEATNSSLDINSGEWYHIILTWGANGISLYINGTLAAQHAGTIVPVVNRITVNADFNNLRGGFGLQDNLALFTEQYSPADALESYNSGAGTIFGAGTTINLTASSPAEADKLNSLPVNINVTGNFSSSTNCSLTLNNTLNETIVFPAGSNIFVNFSKNLADGDHEYFINCSDVNSSKSTTPITFLVDTQLPTEVDNFINNSLLVSRLTGQFNFSDNQLLFSVNISIDNTQLFGQDSIGNNTFQVNISEDISNFSIGDHNLTIRVADGGTITELIAPDSYNPKNGLFNDYLKYDIKKPYNPVEIKMYLKDKSIFDEWSSEKKSDRYSETLIPNKPSSKQTIVVESNRKINIVQKTIDGSHGPEWLVIGEHWKDFILKNEPNTITSIKRIDDFKVEVTIENITNINKLEFDSTGDLNILIRVYNFFKTNTTLTFNSTLFETDTQTNILELNSSGVSTVTAAFFWNDTEQPVTKSSPPGIDRFTSNFVTPLITDVVENISFRWEINISGNNSVNITDNQTVFRMSIDNCSVFTNRSINFTLLNEITGARVAGDIGATFEVWKNARADFRTVSFDFTGQNNYSICIFPENAAYIIDSNNFEYSATGFVTNTYVFDDFVMTNDTQNIDLFFLPENESTDVIITLRDTDDNLLEDYTIRVRRFFPATGEEITTQVLNTDDEGKAVAHLILNDVFYTFSIEKDGTVLELFGPQKIISSSKTFIIDLSVVVLNFEDKVFYTTSPDCPVTPTILNFTFVTSSPLSLVEWFALRAFVNGTEFLDNDSTATGGTARIELNLTNNISWLPITYLIKTDGEPLFSFVQGCEVSNVTAGNLSIMGQKDQWESDVFSVMWRVIAAVFVSIFAMIVFVVYIGPENVGVVGLVTQIGFAIINWIPTWIVIVEALLLIGMYLFASRGES